MNKLNKKIISFVLLFSICLLVNVSYAGTIEAGVNYTYGDYSSSSVSSYGNYSYSQAATIIINYVANKESYSDEFNSFINHIYETYNFNSYLLKESFNSDGSLASNDHYLYFFNSDDEICVDSLNKQNNRYLFGINLDEGDTFLEIYGNTGYYGTLYTITKSGLKTYSSYYSLGLYSNRSIKQTTVFVDSMSNSTFTWDGTSYYYEAPATPDVPATPPLPTNAEIAQAVQAFYNSDYYKNNKDFKEFFVLYNSLKGIYSFIGHNSFGEIAGHFKHGSTLSQHIYTENYPSNTTGLRYWNFSLETLGSQISNVFNNYYWLYSSHDNGISFAYNGKGYVTDLIDVKFDSRYSTIVYSSIDYLCRIYDYENDEETIEDATISGDQYTYDENLDPTTNEYNPLDTFVTIDYPSTLVSRADFEGFMKIFNENKEYIVLPGNANWIILANNSLFNHFSSFIVMCTIFIIIERFMRG